MKHISDIKKIDRCEKLLWLSTYEPQPFSPFITYNEDLTALAKDYLGIEKALEGKRGDGNDVFFQNEKDYDFFIHVRLEYQDLRVQIPIMQKEDDGYVLYFLYALTYPKESEAQPVADQLWVVEHLGISIKTVHLLHLNAEYVRQETLNVQELLTLSDCFYNQRNHPGKDIMEILEEKRRDLTDILIAIDRVKEGGAIEKQRSNICTGNHKCIYFDTCFPQTKDTSVLNLVSSNLKFKMLEEGKEDMSEVDLADVEGTRHQYAQIYAAKMHRLFFDKQAVIHCLIDKIHYPISYLDFEWETYAYPPYEGMKPFDVLAFQYSLHIENENGDALVHKEYLGKDDCRKAFIQQLLSDLPKTGSIVCYNVEGAEKLRLKQLAEQFPEYASVLESVWERMVDLSIPFAHGLIYDSRMAGAYSLKKLVKIFTDYDYADLDISHGIEAVQNYRKLDIESVKAQQETKKELLAYCAMDTYAMVLIYHWILDEIKARS